MSGPYHRPQPWNWFLKRPAYVKFMLRELTAVFIGLYLLFLLLLLARLGQGDQAFIALLAELDSPLAKVLHSVALVAALWHSITWFNLTPQAMPVFRGEKRVPGALVALAMGYGPWAVITVLILWGVWS